MVEQELSGDYVPEGREENPDEGANMCPASDGYWLCTRVRGHGGKHEAWGGESIAQPSAVWDQ